jgi:ABC-type branched-chain amino acid transport system, permease component
MNKSCRINNKFFTEKNKKIAVGIFMVALAVFPLAIQSGLIIRVAVIAALYSIASMGNMVIVGYGGLLTCGHGAFFGLGAYVSAILSTTFGFPFWLCFLLAIVGSAIFGFLISIPCLRVQVDFLSLITIAFAQIFASVAKNWTGLTGGARGIVDIPSASLFGFKFSSQTSYYYLVIIIAIIVYILLNNLMKSSVGRAMQAMRDDEIGARAMGIDINKYKVLAFVLGSIAAGIAGSLMAHYMRYIGPTSFTLDASLLFMQMIILGGLGNLNGAIVGAVFFTVMPEIFRPLAVYRVGLGGAVMLLVVLLRPQGLLGSDAFAATGGMLTKFISAIRSKKSDR